jgi:two-component system phosphate regulon sensor histidine kinase PhoR
MFLVNYIVINFLAQRYILKRIMPIYGRIAELEPANSETNSLEDIDLIELTNNKVMDWAKETDEENQKLRAADVSRKEFIGNVAHELKTPIFNIQGYIDTLLDGGIYDEEINMKYLERTEKNVNRLIATIKDVDTISRLESGRIMLEYSDFDIVELILEVFEIQERLMERFKISLEYLGKKDKKVWVRADKDKVYEILNNLIVNSIKYGVEGGKTVVRVVTEQVKVFVYITDNGIGIPSEHQPHIFTRFYRVDKSRSRERGGSGLGLAIVKHIIEAHGQAISLVSVPGEGTTFSFSLKRGKI